MDMLLNSANWGRKSNNDNDSSQARRKQIEYLFAELSLLRPVPNDDSRFHMTLHLANSPESPLSTSSPHLPRTSSSAATSKALSNESYHPPGSIGATAGNSGSTAVLTIYLPPGFPEDEPKITIQPTVRHFWVDGTVTPCVVTGYDKLMPSGWSHANLGKIIKEVTTSIQRTGVLVGGEHSELYGSNGTSVSNNNTTNNHNGSPAYESYSHKPPPPIPGNRSKGPGQFNPHSPSTFSHANGSHNHYSIGGGSSSSTSFISSSATAEGHHSQSRPQTSTIYSTTLSPEARIVTELSSEQTEEYLESPIAFEHFFDQLEAVVDNRTLRREWWHGNDNVSRRNLQLEAEILELQKSTSEDYEVAMQLQKTLEEKLQQQQDALWRFKPETIQSKLRSAAAESDELSESIAQSFLEGRLDQEVFIRQYRELRKVYHLREMKNERVGSILRNHPSSTNTAQALAGQDGLGSILNMGTGTGTGLGSSASSGLGSGEGTGGLSGSSGEAWVML
ncbi:Vacuolar protein sorting-associated protein 37A [Modicella reniformis]|uniref:Vacuolar protein sorting-associated protein 37A n=1 Tax=Modicella reniformis TaxID=1440133 RepID=A0A9P6IL30_9FUNG|nr:Vacuolar protein sorting-associated protein 37A [Modicella reniformis]